MRVCLDGRCPALGLALPVTDETDDDLVLDAGGLTWASPADLTGLAAWAAAVPAPKRLILPTDTNAGSYLRRMDLLSVMDEHGTAVVGTLPAEDRQSLGHRLIELRRIDDEDSIDDFVSAVFALIETNIGQHHAAAVHGMLGELLDNIPHAHSPVGAYGAAQVYSGATSGEAGIEVSVADPGRGILASLQDNPTHRHIPDCATAIQAALREGVTGETGLAREDSPVRGVGLTQIVRQLQRREGSFLLRSGTGVGRVTARSRHFHTTETNTPGTWAWLRLKATNSHHGFKT